MKKENNILAKVIEMLQKDSANPQPSDTFEEISYRMQVIGLLESISRFALSARKVIDNDPFLFPETETRIISQAILSYLVLIEKTIPKIQAEEDKRFEKAGTSRKQFSSKALFQESLEKLIEEESEALNKGEKPTKSEAKKTTDFNDPPPDFTELLNKFKKPAGNKN